MRDRTTRGSARRARRAARARRRRASDGQRHTEWIGVAPFIEEDLAFASIGQDELGHATMLYELLEGADADRLALLRDPGEYRSCWLAEAACTDWADALVRHWLYDEAELLRWQGLAVSSLQPLRDIATRALAEEAYHRRHATALLDALRTEQEAEPRLLQAASWLVPLGSVVVRATAGPGRRRSGRGRPPAARDGAGVDITRDRTVRDPSTRRRAGGAGAPNGA
jgi:ring-1,2-phenylacetyl-CoA epoxidase subunit PaaC